MPRPSLVTPGLVIFALTASSALAQVNPLPRTNPAAQGNMYANNPVLRYNNPLAQGNMYANNPVLRYNNPLAQGNMYASDPILNPPLVTPGGGFGNMRFLPPNRGNAIGSVAGPWANRRGLAGGWTQGAATSWNGGFGPNGFVGASNFGGAVDPFFLAGPADGFGWGMGGPGFPGAGFAPGLNGNMPASAPGMGQGPMGWTPSEANASSILNGVSRSGPPRNRTAQGRRR